MAPTGAAYSLDQAAALLKSGNFSDFTIRCKEHIFPVHAVILYGKSDFFKAVLTRDFKEKVDRTLDLSDEYKPESVATMIIYCYTNEVHDCNAELPWSQLSTRVSKSMKTVNDMKDQLCHLLDVYNLAKYVMLDGLQQKAGERFFEILQPIKATAADLKQTVLPSVKYAYEVLPTTDVDLRPTVTGWMVYTFQHFNSTPIPEFNKLICELNQLALEMDRGYFIAASFHNTRYQSNSPSETWRKLFQS